MALFEENIQYYFFPYYHNGSIPADGVSFRRSVCIDYFYYNPNETVS